MGNSYRIKTLIPNKSDGWVFAEFGQDPDFADKVFWSAVELFELDEVLAIDYRPVNPVPADEVETKRIERRVVGEIPMTNYGEYAGSEQYSQSTYEVELIDVTTETRVVKEGDL
jgi:hypothetical protein